MKWSTSVQFIGAPFITKRQLNNIIKRMFHEVGVYWHQNFRRRHFTQQAWSLYNYTPRSPRYWWRKPLKLPLVFSGESRDVSENAVIRSTYKAVHVAMPTRKLNLRSANQRVDMADELRQIAPVEHRKLEKVMGMALRKHFRSQRNRVRIRIGGSL